MKKQWTVPMRLVYRVEVTVEAGSEEEARRAADSRSFVDDGLDRGEMVDWAVAGRPKEDKFS